MQMTRWLLGVLLGAAVVHLAAVSALPRLVMSRAMSRLQQAAINEFAHAPLATAAARGIVRPSPDLAYSSLVFDVSTRPLSVTVPLTPPYTSLSGFAANTDNFFAINDLTAGAPEIAIIVVGPNTPRGGLAGGRLVESPSDRGVLLVRRVVPNAAAFAEIDAVRRRASAVQR
jgi:uncharacterized membrane protein